MIIVTQKTGQLGNRLFIFGHLLAYALEHRVSLLYPAFEDYADNFETTKHDWRCAFPPRRLPFGSSRAMRHLVLRFLTLLDCRSRCLAELSAAFSERIRHISATEQTQSIDLDEVEQEIGKGELAFVAGLFVSANRSLEKHAVSVRSYFVPNHRHLPLIKAKLHEARQGYDILVGTHIRHGDYRTFRGGSLFLETREYAAHMRQIVSLLAPARVKFLVCSNESQERSDFVGLDVCQGTGNIVEDLYCLAGCDHIVGAPSSFSGWAGFYGDRPVCWLRRNQPALSDDDLHNYENREPWLLKRPM